MVIPVLTLMQKLIYFVSAQWWNKFFAGRIRFSLSTGTVSGILLQINQNTGGKTHTVYYRYYGTGNWYRVSEWLRS
jgi:hypothetical protein